MAYLFVFIGVSMINAFSKKMSLYEIGFINFAFISITAIGEMLLRQKTVEKRTANFELTYTNLANLNPENYATLKTDISSRTGLAVQSVKILSVDLKSNEAKLKVTFEK
jgi:membrane protease subunit (stomatin/prohibitin family)